MSLMVSDGSEMIRYNPSTASIEASNSRGISWFMRYRCSGMGNVRALTMHKGEIILCSDQGIYVSKSSGKAWSKRNSSERNLVDKQSRGYRELKAVTTDLDMDTLKTRSSLNLDAMRRQQEMSLGGQEEMQRMQLEHQRETMRIQREELQRASRLQTETNFLGAHQADLNAGVQMAQAQAQGRMFAPQMPQTPPMPGMGGMPPMPGSVPQVSYMVGINGQQYGPCDWNQLKQMVQQGQLTHQTNATDARNVNNNFILT